MKKVFYMVNAGLNRITPTALVEKGRNCVTMTTGNPAFTTPTPKLVDLTAACAKLDAANQAYSFNRGKLDKDARDLTFAELKGLIVEFAAYVQSVTSGQKDLILSAGLDVRRGSSPLGDPAAPTNVRAVVTPYPGRLEVRWGASKGRLLYDLQYCSGDPNVPANWSTLLLTSKNRYTAEDLDSGKVYYFRVVALGAAGASPVSDVATAKAA